MPDGWIGPEVWEACRLPVAFDAPTACFIAAPGVSAADLERADIADPTAWMMVYPVVPDFPPAR